MAVWIVKGKFERHQRKFEVDASTRAQAEYEAEVMIRAVYSQGRGAYSRLVWQQGDITIKDTDTGNEFPLFVVPDSLEGL